MNLTESTSMKYPLLIKQIRKPRLIWEIMILEEPSPQTQDVNWTYIRRWEDVLDVFWTSYVRSIYVLCLRRLCLKVLDISGPKAFLVTLLVSTLINRLFASQYNTEQKSNFTSKSWIFGYFLYVSTQSTLPFSAQGTLAREHENS